jgi:hypothetical protein
MSLSAHTIYQHVPLFKEDTFTSSTTDCFNKNTMVQRNMRTPATHMHLLSDAEKARRKGVSEMEKRRAKGDEAVTQVVCCEGVTAWRRGGWEGSSSSDSTGNGKGEEGKRVFEKPEYENMGIRARVLLRGLVYCRWGRARRGTNGARGEMVDNVTGKKIHGDMWREGGFVEFVAVHGVGDWIEAERVEREKERAERDKEREREEEKEKDERGEENRPTR